MIVIPAVDIRNSQCVQLVQGKTGTERYYGNPVQIAKEWEEKGAHLLHVIDLDAAFEEGDNRDVVKMIANSVTIPIQFGGGMRSAESAEDALTGGINRIIMGTAAIKNPDIVKALSKKYGKNRIMVAVDSIGGKVTIKGWTEKTDINTIDLIKELKDYAFAFLVTDVDREGLMKGIDIKEFKKLVDTGARICASGGVSSQKDVEALDKIGMWGCVIGKALYEGKIKLSSAKGKIEI